MPAKTKVKLTKQKHLLFDLSKADYITLSAVLIIVIAFWLLLNGQTDLAIALAFVSTFLDYLDGVIARKYGSSKYGKIYDSLYDVLGWVMFPSLTINIISGWNIFAVIITSLFIISSIIRLGRFTADGYVETDKRYYVGLPVLYSKYALLLVYFYNTIPSLIILLIMIPWMISSNKTPKPQPFTAQIELVYALIFFLVYIF